MKKLEIKLKHFEDLEAIMDRERESVSGIVLLFVLINTLLIVGIATSAIAE